MNRLKAPKTVVSDTSSPFARAIARIQARMVVPPHTARAEKKRKVRDDADYAKRIARIKDAEDVALRKSFKAPGEDTRLDNLLELVESGRCVIHRIGTDGIHIGPRHGKPGIPFAERMIEGIILGADAETKAKR